MLPSDFLFAVLGLLAAGLALLCLVYAPLVAEKPVTGWVRFPIASVAMLIALWSAAEIAGFGCTLRAWGLPIG